MFNSLLTDLQDKLFESRLEQAKEDLQQQTFTTKDECQAEVHGALNRIINLGNNMTPLVLLRGETPALAGELSNNLDILNNDSAAVVSQLIEVENNASAIYNLLAAAQNAARQKIRNFVFGSTQSTYLEGFVNNSAIDLSKSTATIDTQAGVAMAPVLLETKVPLSSIESGVSSIGSTSSDFSLLTDGNSQTAFIWNGSVLEFLVSFSSPQVVNRMIIDLDNYKGLQIKTFSSSPDGSIYDDILADLEAGTGNLDATSCKYSGDVILDFPAKSIISLRIVLSDSSNSGVIGIRDISFFSRKYAAQGTIQSLRCDAPVGNCTFTADTLTKDNLTSISHQISFDGVNFHAIQNGDLFNVPGPFWYKALFSRSDSNFDTISNPLVPTGVDPVASDNYQIGSITTTNISPSVVERSISITSILGALALQETPLPGTLSVYFGAALAPASAYTISDNTLHFPASHTGVLVRYQTSALGTAGLSSRKEFYTPYLYRVEVSKV
jgi:hypothetical protein